MALIKCHECAGSVSTEAAACPRCGAKPRAPATPEPGRERMTTASQIGIVAVGCTVAVFFIAGTFSSDDPAQQAKKDAACRNDVQCWGERHLIKASVYCKSAVEQLALHSVKWTDGDLGRFSRWKWLDDKSGALTFIGDRVEFQNGFGAFTPMTYACDLGDLDQETPKVLDARVLGEGRLPQ